MVRKTAQEMIDYANELDSIEKHTLERKQRRKWFVKRDEKYLPIEEVSYQLINGDIKHEDVYRDKKKTIIYYKELDAGDPCFQIRYNINGNIESIDEGYIHLPSVPVLLGGSNLFKRGTYIGFLENGRVGEDKFFNPAGCLSGYYKRYHSNGNIAISGQFINKGETGIDRCNGRWVWYYEDGNIGQEINFNNGWLLGDLILYDKYGNITEKKTYSKKDNMGVRDTPHFEMYFKTVWKI